MTKEITEKNYESTHANTKTFGWTKFLRQFPNSRLSLVFIAKHGNPDSTYKYLNASIKAINSSTFLLSVYNKRQ